MSRRIQEQDRLARELAVLEKEKDSRKLNTSRVFKSEIAFKKQLQSEIAKTKEPFPEGQLKLPQENRSQKCSHQKRTSDLDPKFEKLSKKENAIEQKKPKTEKRREKNVATDFNHKESDAFFRIASELGTQTSAQPAEPVAPTLSKELINSLVENIYSCVQADQSKGVSIILKNGVLSGTKIKVSSNGTMVKVSFSSSNSTSRSLLANTQKILKDRLAEKHISIGEFVIH